MSAIVVEEQPAPSPAGASPGVRFVGIRANLLPDDIVIARRAVALRNRVGIALAALVVVLVAAYGFSWWQTNSASNDLTSLERQGVALQNQQEAFGPLVTAQQQTQTIQTQLGTLMVGDMQWKDLLTTLRAKAPSGVSVAQVSGTLTVGAGSDPSALGGDTLGALNQSGVTQVGALNISGTAPDKRTVAAFVDQLGHVRGLTAPFVTSVASSDKRDVTFTAEVLITQDALGGRYTPSTGTTSPKGH